MRQIRPTDIALTPGDRKRVFAERFIPSISADLEEICSQQNAVGRIYDYFCKSKSGRLSVYSFCIKAAV